MASKKGGLGAQKVSSKSFSDLEKKAQAADKLREKEESTGASKKSNRPEESMCVTFTSSFFKNKIVFLFLLLYSPSVLPFFFFLNLPAFFLLSSPSLRLACKDFEQQRKMEEKKLKGLEGNRKEQAERLGMGLGMRRYDDDEETTTSDPVAYSRICFHMSVSCSHYRSAVECLTL